MKKNKIKEKLGDFSIKSQSDWQSIQSPLLNIEIEPIKKKKPLKIGWFRLASSLVSFSVIVILGVNVFNNKDKNQQPTENHTEGVTMNSNSSEEKELSNQISEDIAQTTNPSTPMDSEQNILDQLLDPKINIYWIEVAINDSDFAILNYNSKYSINNSSFIVPIHFYFNFMNYSIDLNSIDGNLAMYMDIQPLSLLSFENMGTITFTPYDLYTKNNPAIIDVILADNKNINEFIISIWYEDNNISILWSLKN